MNESSTMFPHALFRASESFRIHADQRMRLLNFFILLILGLATAYVTALQENILYATLAISLVVFLLTYIFWRLDARTSELIKVSENALQDLEVIISSSLDKKSLLIIEKSNEKKSYSYTQSFRMVFAISLIFSSSGFAVSCWKIYNI